MHALMKAREGKEGVSLLDDPSPALSLLETTVDDSGPLATWTGPQVFDCFVPFRLFFLSWSGKHLVKQRSKCLAFALSSRLGHCDMPHESVADRYGQVYCGVSPESQVPFVHGHVGYTYDVRSHALVFGNRIRGYARSDEFSDVSFFVFF